MTTPACSTGAIPTVALVHGVPHNHDSGITDAQQVQMTLSALARGMHEADLSLSRLTASTDDRAALSASRALSLLATCQMKFADLMEVQS